jgi:hypothetical protein
MHYEEEIKKNIKKLKKKKLVSYIIIIYNLKTMMMTMVWKGLPKSKMAKKQRDFCIWFAIKH